jgi:hypothetical protein
MRNIILFGWIRSCMMHLSMIWIVSLRNVFIFFMIDNRKVIYLSFCIQFFRQCVSIAFQCASTFATKKKITLVGDARYRPLITIRSHNLR